MDETTPPPVPSPEPKPAETAPESQAVATAESTGVPPNVAAGICAILPLVGGIIFLVLEKKNSYVRFWAMQSLFFGGATFAISILLQVATFILSYIPILGKLLLFILGLASIAYGVGVFVLWVVTIIKAFSGKEWEIPYLGKLARKQLAGQKLI